MAKQKIIIFSPHLDDAALSCADHILTWRQEQKEVQVVTVFTEFKAKKLPATAQVYLKNSGFSDVNLFQKARIKEDLAAMEEMDCTWEHLGYVDAGFRSERVISQFSEKMDQRLLTELEESFVQFVDDQTIYYLPFGVGGHLDHLLVKKAGEKILPASQIHYYIDYPYASHFSNWLKIGFKGLWRFICTSKSMFLTSSAKKEVLSCYTSQMPLMFKNRVHYSYPEIMLPA